MVSRKYKVVEIFTSIQGEAEHTGKPVVFVRLHGCNLNCSFCDEPLHKGPTYTEMTELEIGTQCNLPTIVITGGEPSLTDINPLIVFLKERGYFVCVETNGFSYNNIREANWKTLSPKSKSIPAGAWNEIKIPCNEETFDLDFLKRVASLSPAQLWLQPINGFNTINEEAVKFCFKKCIELNLGLSIQLHKMIGVQ